MSKNGIYGIAAFGLILLLFIPSFAAADDDSMKVIITTPNDRYVKDGDTIDFTVHVFDKGEYLDIDKDNVNAIVYCNYSKASEIDLKQSGKGQFKGHYTVDANTLDRDYFYIEATSKYKMNSDDDYYKFDLEDEEDKEDDEEEEWSLFLYADNPEAMMFPKAGDSINFTLECYRNSDLADAPSIENLSIDVYCPDWNVDTIIPEHTSTGKYHFTYTIPQMYEYIGGKFSVKAKLWIDWLHSARSDLTFTVVQYRVWAHVTAMTSDSITLDVYVADKYGKALEGVEVDLSMYVDITDDFIIERLYNVTDRYGRAHFYKNYSSQWSYMDISGEVEKEGIIEDLDWIYLSNPNYEEEEGEEEEEEDEEPYGRGLVVIERGNSDGYYLEPGKSYTKKFRAYYIEHYGDTPNALSDKEVYYYIYTRSEIIAHGKVTTDSTGDFKLTFTTPCDADTGDVVNIDFDAPVSTDADSWDKTNDGMIYDDDYRRYYISPSSQSLPLSYDSDYTISVDRLNLGDKTRVVVNMPSSSEERTLRLFYIPEKIDKDIWSNTQQREWYCLSYDNDIELTGNIDNPNLNLVIPEYLPHNGKYSFFAVVMDTGKVITLTHLKNKDIPKYYHSALLYVEPGKGASGNVGAEVGDKNKGILNSIPIETPILTGFILIIVVIIVVIAVVVRRKKGGGDHLKGSQEAATGYTSAEAQLQQPVQQTVYQTPMQSHSPYPSLQEQPESTCHSCGQPATYVPEYKRWYCPTCQRYI